MTDAYRLVAFLMRDDKAAEMTLLNAAPADCIGMSETVSAESIQDREAMRGIGLALGIGIHRGHLNRIGRL